MTMAIIVLLSLFILWHALAWTAAALDSGPFTALAFWIALIFVAYQCIS